MLKLIAQPQVIVLAGLGSIACCMAALVFKEGYRRGPIGIAVLCIFVSAILPLLVFLRPGDTPIIWLLSLISGCMALATMFLVPLLTIAGLSDGSCFWKIRLWHAAFVVSAWILGCGSTFLGFGFGLH